MTAKELIYALGGPSKVAKALGLGKYGSQRVHNWVHRGIPYEIQLKYPLLRMEEEKKISA